MKQVHPVEDIGISPWPVDMVEFSADVYVHWKQVGIKQLYNRMPQTAWVSQFELQLQLESVGTRCQCENQLADRGPAALRDPQLSSPAKMRKKCCYGQRNFGSICSSLSMSPTHSSHITNINPFATLSRIKCERYIFYKEVCSFVHWSCQYVDYVSAYIMYMYVCDYTTPDMTLNNPIVRFQ